MKIYVNGSEITIFSTDTNPTLNYDAKINNNVLHNIGRQKIDIISLTSPAPICLPGGKLLLEARVRVHTGPACFSESPGLIQGH
jgi:hypothetical protein